MEQKRIHKSGYRETPDTVFSWDTCILQVVSGGLTVGNVTWYSWSTSRHQTRARSRTADVRLDDVPKGVEDLLALAVERGLAREMGILLDMPMYELVMAKVNHA